MKSKNIKKLLAFSILTLSLIAIVIIIQRRSRLEKRIEPLVSEGQSELRLVQTDGTKEIFELYAKKHFPEKNGRYRLSEGLKINIKRKAEGKDILIEGKNGIYEKDLNYVTIQDCRVKVEDLSITTKEIVYTSQGYIKSLYPTQFLFKNGKGEASSFVYDLNQKYISASNFKGEFEKKETIHIEADKINFSYKENSGVMEGNCSIKSNEFYIESDRIDFAFSEDLLVYAKGSQNSKIYFYGEREGEGVMEIIGRKGEKVLSCDVFEIKRNGDIFNGVALGNCEIEFPSKESGEKGYLRAGSINFVYEKEKGLKEVYAEGRVYFQDYKVIMEANKIYGKTEEKTKEWEIFNAEGKVKFRDDLILECEHFRKERNQVLLEKGRPFVKRDEEIIYADKILYDSEKKIMKGFGNVKAFLGKKTFSSILFFQEGKKVFATGEAILWNEIEGKVNLEGNASIEQGEQFLKSNNLNIDINNNNFSAYKDVSFLFLTEDEKMFGSAEKLEYSKEKGVLLLQKNTKINARDYSIKGATLNVYLDKDGNIEFIEGFSRVEFISKDIEGRGDKFSFDLKNKNALFEENPILKDVKRGKITGRKISINLDTKEIKVEGNVSEVEIKEKK